MQVRGGGGGVGASPRYFCKLVQYGGFWSMLLGFLLACAIKSTKATVFFFIPILREQTYISL